MPCLLAQQPCISILSTECVAALYGAVEIIESRCDDAVHALGVHGQLSSITFGVELLLKVLCIGLDAKATDDDAESLDASTANEGEGLGASALIHHGSGGYSLNRGYSGSGSYDGALYGGFGCCLLLLSLLIGFLICTCRKP